MSDSPCLSVFLFVCHPVCLFQPMASYLFACFDCTLLGKLIFGVLKFYKEMEVHNTEIKKLVIKQVT